MVDSRIDSDLRDKRRVRRRAPEADERVAKIAVKLPVLSSQPHGGALYSGGVPGHPGAGGRPPSVLRQRLRGSFEERIPVLEEIADDSDADPQDRIRALDILGKYGIGTVREVTADEVRERLRTTVGIIREALAPAVADALLSRLKEVWTTK
jgi:hypothetical protein